MLLHELALQGRTNIYSSMAAGIVNKLLEVRKDIIKESLGDFQNVEHRLEFVTRVHGIEFINDSKATNANSAWYALESMTKPVIWIVGGKDNLCDYDSLLPLVKQKVKAIVCLGLESSRIHEAFSGIVSEIVDSENAEEAVKLAYNLGRNGDVVLLSPASASFEMFDNYEDRGHKFKEAVREL
ncbi:MAG: hypothetical protein HXX09_08885 [Bacteroidetes bacterium]|nr:hypothetical protein [Bacteroidota bacterium]